MDKFEVIKRVIDEKIVAVIRGANTDEAIKISRACIKGGVQLIELTFTVPNVDRAIVQLIHEYGNDVVVGAGTVLEATTARIAIMAGAQFIVSPGFDADTARLCNLYQIPYMAGCMTITEMMTANAHGVDIIKLFPGSQFGPSFIKAVHGPLPHVKIMPTGGVNLDNAQEWIKNGAIALGVGGNLTKGNTSQITQTAKLFVSKLRED